MNIQVHANEAGEMLVDETHDVQACFLNAFFEKILREYKGGYSGWCKDMHHFAGSHMILAMADILKVGNPATEAEENL